MDDLIPDMPDWFKQYIESLPTDRKDDLSRWVNCGDGAAVLDTLTYELEK